MDIINSMYQQVHILSTKYYKSFVRISFPTGFGESQPFSGTLQQKRIYVCLELSRELHAMCE